MATIFELERNGEIIRIQKGIQCDSSLLDKPRIWVDFNSPWQDSYPLSQVDIILNSNGDEITLSENLQISIFDIDFDKNNKPDYLLADGIVILNQSDIQPNSKWLVKIIANALYGQYYWVSDTK